MSKVTYSYDEGGDSGLSNTSQHDGNYGTSFNYRGNLTSVRRWDVTVPTSEGSSVVSQTAYNIAGSPISKTDPRGRVTTVSYADNWNDASRTTYAYPTTVTDPGGFSSSIEYRYDIGANVAATSPAPAGATYGKTTSRIFNDTTGRITKELINNTGAYTRYAYATTGNAMTTYTTVVDVNSNNTGDTSDEVTTLTEFDGAGRVRRTRTENPNSTGGWTASVSEYDFLGRVYRTSLPTEVSVSGDTWTPSGDDSTGWRWNYNYYDWMDRVIRTRPSDSDGTNQNKDTLIEYAGCGCAGGLVTTIKGPVTDAYGVNGQWQTGKRRWQKVYEDILGRKYKTEQWDLDGQNNTIYSSTKTFLNGRDQATMVREYSGSEYSSTYQDTTMAYDGHGRLIQKHLPQWYAHPNPAYTTTTYNEDDTVATATDPRGVVTTYSYGKPGDQEVEDRALLTKLEYDPPSSNPTPTDPRHVPDTPDVLFAYDNVGNRLTMTDGSGTLTYAYDELSRLRTETKVFIDDPNNSYPLTYDYHLGGALKSIKDPFTYEVNYAADRLGRVTEVGSPSIAPFASNIKYRAFGSVKQLTMGTTAPTTLTFGYDNSLRPSTYDANNSANGSSHVQQAGYVYGNDGRVKEIDNVKDGNFDQTNEYDFAGRLKKNLVGTSGSRFSQTMGYDAFNNLTTRTNSIYGTYGDSFSTSYWNNRPNDIGSMLDNLGNVVQSISNAPGIVPPGGGYSYTDTKKWSYDSAGQVVHWSEHGPWGGSITRHEYYTNDGDGRAAIWLDRYGISWRRLFSSVTGQKITDIVEGQSSGNRVYLGDTVLHDNTWNGQFTTIGFKSIDPVSGSSQELHPNGEIPNPTGTSGVPNARVERAGLGMAVPTATPQSYPEPEYGGGGFVGHAESGCAWDGAPISCNDINMILRRGGNITIYVNERADGGFGLYTSLRNHIRTWRYDVYPKPGTPDMTPDNGDIIRVGTPVARFYVSYVSPHLSSVISRLMPLGDKAENRRTLNRIAEKALKVMESNENCRKAISSTSLDAVDVLKQMKPPSLYENSGLVNAGDQDNPSYNAYTSSGPIQGVTRGTIEFYSNFFDKGLNSAMGSGTVRDKLGLEDAQLLTMLHEIGHATRKYVHPNEMSWVTKQAAKLVVDNQWDNAPVNQYIYDNCFKK